MSVTVQLPNVLARLADGQRALAADGGTVGDVVGVLAERFPSLGPRLRGPDGTPYEFVTLYLNDEDIRFADGFATPVRDGDRITVVPAVAGG